MIKELSIWSRLVVAYLGLCIINYFITYTIIEGTIFNPFHKWLSENYMRLKGTGTSAEFLWKKASVLFSCPHCLGTHVGLWLIAVPFVFLFGIQLRYFFSKTPPENFEYWLQMDSHSAIERRFFGRVFFMITRPFFTMFCIMVIGFGSAAGSLAVWELFKYPAHKLEIAERNATTTMIMQQEYLNEILEKMQDCERRDEKKISVNNN